MPTSIHTLICAVVLTAATARAQETIVHVPKSWADAVAVDCSGLRAAGPQARLLVETLEGDIRRSGWLTPSAAGRGTVNVSGACADRGDGVQLQCAAVLHATGQTYFSRTYNASAGQVRQLAHQVADELVAAITGKRGIASTRLLLVGLRGGSKEVYVCDADGGNVQQVTRDDSVSLLPRWAPDGQRFVYTSFKGGFPDVYEVDLQAGQRTRIAKFSGLNVGASYAPDGRTIALTLSKDGNPELYTMAPDGDRLTRLTRSAGAGETSPSFSPDGRQIVFVSDSSGTPQLYVMARNGGERRRITFTGRENVAPHWGPDGRIVYSSRRFGRYQICVLDPRTRGEDQLTQEDVDHEDPVWAPNSRHVAYTRSEGGRTGVYVLDTATKASLPLRTSSGDWYTPSWSPQ